MRTRSTSVSRMSSVCITLLIMLSGAATSPVLADDYTVGGVIYTDLSNPLASGEPNVTVTVSGGGSIYTGVSSGPMGIWQINDVPEGTYTVTPAKQGIGFQHLVDGVSDGLSSIIITVNAANRAASRSIQFLAGEPAQYNLDVSVIGGHGSVSADSGTYLAGTQVSLIATPEDGYRVMAWDGIDDGSTAQDLNRALVTITADKVVTVEFEVIPPGMYTLTVEQPEGGSISVSPVAPSSVYAEGTIVTLTVSLDAGYQVKAWIGTDNDPAAGSATNTVTVTEDITVTVELEVAFTIGGAIYTDLENPLASGLADVTVTVTGAGKTFTTTTHGSQGLWHISNLHPGAYTITPSATRQEFEHIANGTSDEQLSITISVNSENRADSQSIQFLAVEPQADNLVITKMKLKAGKSRLAKGDSITVSGVSFDASTSDFYYSNTIYVEIYNQGDEIPVLSDEIRVGAGRFRNGKFSYKGSKGRITLKCDLNKNTFSIVAKKVDLSRLSSPVRVDIEVGDYHGSGIAYDGEVLGSGINADVINKKKPMPMQFMMGHADTLRVDKCKFKLGTKSSTDSLTIQGALAVADTSINFGGEDVLVTWGDYSITLPASDLYPIGAKKAFKYKKPRGTSSSIAVAIFDLEKCKFKIVIKKAGIGPQGKAVDFSLQFGAYDETVTVPLMGKKQNQWRFP